MENADDEETILSDRFVYVEWKPPRQIDAIWNFTFMQWILYGPRGAFAAGVCIRLISFNKRRCPDLELSRFFMALSHYLAT